MLLIVFMVSDASLGLKIAELADANSNALLLVDAQVTVIAGDKIKSDTSESLPMLGFPIVMVKAVVLLDASIFPIQPVRELVVAINIELVAELLSIISVS